MSCSAATMADREQTEEPDGPTWGRASGQPYETAGEVTFREKGASDAGTAPRSTPSETADVAPREKKAEAKSGISHTRSPYTRAPVGRDSMGPLPSRETRVCELDGCEETFRTKRSSNTRRPLKRFCCERHQRIAEKRRYRARHREWINCKGCGTRFERSSTDNRPKVYCTVECQAESRSAEYLRRDDIGRPRHLGDPRDATSPRPSVRVSPTMRSAETPFFGSRNDRR